MNPITGEIRLFPYARGVQGWLFCAGQKLNISEHPALYQLIGNKFGGDGVTDFALPDLRGLEPLQGTGYYIAAEGQYPTVDQVADDTFTGEVRLFPFDFTPGGWLPADGRSLVTAAYPNLFGVYGDSFTANGGNLEKFNLPGLSFQYSGIKYYVSTQGLYPPSSSTTGSEYTGELILFPKEMPYSNWTLADGSAVGIRENQVLYSRIGEIYGGDGRTVFFLPNLISLYDSNLYYYIQLSGSYPLLPDDPLPRAQSDSYIVKGPMLEVLPAEGVLRNDSNALTAKVVDQPSHGMLTLERDGAFAYYPYPDYTGGEDSFTYVASNNNKSSEKVSVTLTFERGTTPVPVVHTVSFDSSGGSAVADQTVKEGEKAVEPTPAPTRSGYTFGGWYTDSGQTTSYDFSTPVTANLTLYAKWTEKEYSVSFETSGGSAVATQTLKEGEKAVEPTPAPTRGGYTFGGWYTDSGQTTPYDFSTPVTANLTLYAKWTEKEYTVGFESNGGSAVASQTLKEGEKAVEPTPVPTRSGYTFGGWYTDSGQTTPYDFSTPVAADLALYAKWTEKEYTVSFESSGGSAVASQTLKEGGKAVEPTPAPTRGGYTFGGWYTDSGQTTPYDFSTPVTADLTLYAKWTEKEYTVSFESSGGSAVASQTLKEGEKAVEPTPAPTRGGYTFGGWYTDSGQTTPYDFSTPVTADLTLYAKWTEKEYSVSFETSGGSAVASQTLKEGEKAVEPTPAPTRGGYTFGGWYTDSGLTAPYDFNTPVTGNLTLYAKWTEKEYTVSFESSGGSAVATQTLKEGEKAVEPTPAPTRSGYTFGGWYTDSGLTAPYDFSTPVTANLTLYAKWTEKEYTVGFESNGGSAVATQTLKEGGKAVEPTPAPTRGGYTFGGWYTDSGQTTPYDFSTPVTADLTLYAKWTEKEYTVSFESSGGSAVASQTLKEGEKAVEPTPAPTRSGYTFGGWYTDSGLTAPYDFSTPVTANLTLYAKWTKVSEPVPSTPPAPAPPSSSGGGVSAAPAAPTPSPTPSPSPEVPIEVTINGAGIKLKLTERKAEDGRTIATASIDESTLHQAFTSSSKLVTIEVSSKAPIIEVKLPGQPLLSAAKQNSSAAVKISTRGAVSYLLPISALPDLTPSEAVVVTLAEGSQADDGTLQQAAAALGAQVMLKHAVQFGLKVNGEEIRDFNGGYIERTLSLPSGTEPSEVTAVWADAANKLHYVPSRLTTEKGTAQLELFSPYNGTFLVIQVNRTFADMEKHWAKSDAELLASKLIVNGRAAQSFAPGSDVTRAEFAALLVRALGYAEQAPVAAYNDVRPGDWYYGAIGAAQRLQLIFGTGEGSFLPQEKVTREQMAEMVARALAAAGADVQADVEVLSRFKDAGTAASWSKEALAKAAAAGILQGTADGMLFAHDPATRAQAVVMVKRLLQYLQFIK
ncbi:hypothetical protein DCC85_21305 [Paenibacillus sp. CAA11]|uniref:InlB B-repeat-containing protein n=1 Tax=Paenibacillus sp. CAA11 TaxID=1532905 RepID=UPI000D33FF4D|nr:InlB B-repeat-containing protein [Paenibacillus sp. CAA11]AWB46455.1 hypothetical protein DCC85_21305 [Paenibacillus sp. CAA11]